MLWRVKFHLLQQVSQRLSGHLSGIDRHGYCVTCVFHVLWTCGRGRSSFSELLTGLVRPLADTQRTHHHHHHSAALASS